MVEMRDRQPAIAIRPDFMQSVKKGRRIGPARTGDENRLPGRDHFMPEDRPADFRDERGCPHQLRFYRIKRVFRKSLTLDYS